MLSFGVILMVAIIKIFLLLLFIPTILLSGEYVVIANHKIQNLSSAQIRTIFFKKRAMLGGIKLIPVNLGARDPIREKFEKKVLKMNLHRLKAYWAKQHYLGHRPPLSMKSQESIKAFVKKVDGAIGYIEKENLDKDLKVLYSWED
jgi:hypothetical protein